MCCLCGVGFKKQHSKENSKKNRKGKKKLGVGIRLDNIQKKIASLGGNTSS